MAGYALVAAIPSLTLAVSDPSGAGAWPLLFVAASSGAGFLLGRRLGDDQTIVAALRPAARVPDDLRAAYDGVVRALADGGVPGEIEPLVARLTAAPVVEQLVRLEDVEHTLRALDRIPRRDDGSPQPERERLLLFLARVGALGDVGVRFRVLSAFARRALVDPRVTPYTVDVCRRLPEAWNDVQPALQRAAEALPGVGRYLRDHADPRQSFVGEADAEHMRQMVRFREAAHAHQAQRDAEASAALTAVLDRETRWLAATGEPTRRLPWFAGQASRIHDLFTDAHLDELVRAARGDLPAVHDLLGALVLAWAGEPGRRRHLPRVLATLGQAAHTQLSAANALIAVYLGLRSADSPERRAVRDHAWEAAQSASQANFAVTKRLSEAGIPAQPEP